MDVDGENSSETESDKSCVIDCNLPCASSNNDKAASHVVSHFSCGGASSSGSRVSTSNTSDSVPDNKPVDAPLDPTREAERKKAQEELAVNVAAPAKPTDQCHNCGQYEHWAADCQKQ